MALTMTAGTLASGLKKCRLVVDRYVTIPMLGCVEMRDGKLFATDLDLEIEIDMPKDGTADLPLIDFRALAGLARLIDADEPVTLDGTDSTDHACASIAFNGSRYQMPVVTTHGKEEREFLPRIGMPEAPMTATGNMGLSAAFRRVAPFISSEETRYYLNGVCLSRDRQDRRCLVATDGHRLGWIVVPELEQADHLTSDLILPRCLVAALLALKTEPQGMALHPDRGGRAQFTWPGMRLASKLIDGAYPDWKRVVPDFSDGALVYDMPRGPVLAALKRLLAVGRATSGSFHVYIKLQFGGEGLRLQSRTGDNLLLEEKIATEGWEHPACIYLNGNYLTEALRAFTGADTVCMNFRPSDLENTTNTCDGPVLLTAEGDPLHVVQMPLTSRKVRWGDE